MMRIVKVFSLMMLTMVILGISNPVYCNIDLPKSNIKIETNNDAHKINITNNTNWTIDVYTIFSMDGSIVSSGIISNTEQSINVSELNSGIYFITLYTKNQELITKKLIVK